MANVTTLNPRTYAVRKALERYAELHPSQAGSNALQDDLRGFITDLLADILALADEQEIPFDVFDLWRHAVEEYAREPRT